MKSKSAAKNKIALKRIPLFQCGSQAITDMGILDAKILLRPDEVAAILRVSLSQIYEMIDQGHLETAKAKPKRVQSISVKRYLSAQGVL